MTRYRTRWRSRRSAARKRALLVPVLIIIISVFSTVLVDRALSPVLMAIAEEQAMIIVSERIGATVEELLYIHIDTDELVTVEKDSDGRITMLRADSLRVSRLAAQVTLAVQDELSRMEGERFYIPLGQTFGATLLAGVGPKIPVTMYPLGSAAVFIGDKFEDAGINQTRHVLYLDIEATLRVVVPLQRTRLEVGANFPVCDTIIVGEVPWAYLNMQRPD